MPARLSVILPFRQIQPRWHRRLNLTFPAARPQFFEGSVSVQQRSASILAGLSGNPKAYKTQKRRGRGPASGLGKTSGRGHKGQRQHGKVPAGFEGGQTPQHVVHPERGVTNIFSKDITPLPLSRIQSWIAQGRIDPTRPITPLQLLSSRCVHNIPDGIKLLARSHRHDASLDAQQPLTQPLHIVVSRASAQAIAAVEAAGGTVTTRYFTKTALRNIMQGRMHPAVSLRTHPAEAVRLGATAIQDTATRTIEDTVTSSGRPTVIEDQSLPQESPLQVRIRTGFQRRLPDPTSRKELEYYRDAGRRGYLAHEVPEGDSPSLYFKTHLQKQREKLAAHALHRVRKQRRRFAGPGEQVVQRRLTRPGERIRVF